MSATRNNKKIRWAILGTSFISHQMAKAIQHATDAELYAIGSRSEANAYAFGKEYHVTTQYTDFEKLLHDENIDAVYIGLSNHLHKEWILRCAAAGKHVLCEKPLVLNEQEFSEIEMAVKKANVICLEALMYQYHPYITELKKLTLDDRAIGDIISFNAAYTADIASFANPTAGGATRNLGCYPLSLIRLLANAEPIKISATGMMNPVNNTDNNANIELTFANAVTAHIYTADNVAKSYVFEITGTKGKMICNANPWMASQDNNTVTIYDTRDNIKKVISINAALPLYTYQINLVSQSILNDDIVKLNDASLKHSRGNVITIRECLDQIVAYSNVESTYGSRPI